MQIIPIVLKLRHEFDKSAPLAHNRSPFAVRRSPFAVRRSPFADNSASVKNAKNSKLFAKSSGFTIIEVALVLAIAGLIFLVVFLALPALQRSQRDTARRQDVAKGVVAVQQFYADGGDPSQITRVGYSTIGSGTSPLDPYLKNAGLSPSIKGFGFWPVLLGSDGTQMTWPYLGDMQISIGDKCVTDGAAKAGARVEYGGEGYMAVSVRLEASSASATGGADTSNTFCQTATR